MEKNSFLQCMEFHISKKVREVVSLDKSLFSSYGNTIFASHKDIHTFVFLFNNAIKEGKLPKDTKELDVGIISIMGLIDEIFHYIFRLYRRDVAPLFFENGYAFIKKYLDDAGYSLEDLFSLFLQNFPNDDIYNERINIANYLNAKDSKSNVENSYLLLEELCLLFLTNENPSFSSYSILFENNIFTTHPAYNMFKKAMWAWSKKNADFGSTQLDIISFLMQPIKEVPNSPEEQLKYIKTHWAVYIKEILYKILEIESFVSQTYRPTFPIHYEGESEVITFIPKEKEGFSKDTGWMPNVVLLAKNTFVYLDQLSKRYKKKIEHIDEIPDEEFEHMQEAGINALWLIGLWQRSLASERIKKRCGNPDAIASAYSIFDYQIAEELGGKEALKRLKNQATRYGIRLAADMVPNHTAIDSIDVIRHPTLFLQTSTCPFPSYDFSGEPIAQCDNISIYLENHYYSKTDCAVVFKRMDGNTGSETYIYHGNDGTGLPWNDTAQLDFLNAETRENIIAKIIEIAKDFPIIRFDAAMVLTQRHIRRLWYPSLGQYDGIPGRIEHHISDSLFYSKMPQEFWREVVDRLNIECPETLLLAEAFWMMEGYFVRSLGMHRVYNSAFMNMLKREENQKYRETIKNTIVFDKEVLKRYVNFMSNPDEEPATIQFGRQDKYFGVCTMMICLPGLPMFSHGQFLGMEEKYGMEYKKAYRDERGDMEFLERHKKKIFPLLKKRYLFSSVTHFYFYDVLSHNGTINENIFAWSNMHQGERSLVFYNNKYERGAGTINLSAPFRDETEDVKTTSFFDALMLHDKKGYYTIFYEFHSSLYYIRSNQELKEKGFFVMLEGFESQVFLNIKEVDDVDGKYKNLCDSLNGRGYSSNFEETID